MATFRARLTNKKLLPPLVLGGLLAVAAAALLNPPTADRAPPERGPRLSVEAMTLASAAYQVKVPSFGSVQPRTRSMLVSQVGGEIMWVSPQFRDGGVFAAGDALLKLDSRDYEADVQIAQATLLEAQQSLAEERALSQQAMDDWNRLGDDSEASDLVLRKPQLLAAQAAVAGAEAGLRKARLSLERSTVTAPFAGRILSTEVDLGEVIGSSSQLAEIYATDYVEVRLPLANADLDYIDLPEPGADTGEVPVQIHSSLSGGPDWPGFLVRTEGAIDDSSQQLHVVAQINDPFQLEPDNRAEHSGRKPLKIGEYITASIQGRTLLNAIVIPNSTIYQGSYVYLVQEGVLRRRDIVIAWQNDTDAVISAGLQAGDTLVTTPLGQVTSGTRVSIEGQQTQVVARPARPKPSGTGPGRRGAEDSAPSEALP